MDSTPIKVICTWFFAGLGTDALGKKIEDLLISHFGVDGFLLLIIVIFAIRECHHRNLRKESDDREKSMKESLKASDKRNKVLEERLKLSDDHLKVIEERSRVIDERNVLSKERLAVGKELLSLMELRRSIAKFPTLLRRDVANQPSILLVEDEKSNHIYQDAIEEAFPEMEVRLANNGAEALAEITRKRPCLVITDVIMPVLNGYELLRRLKREFPKIPVLVISAYIDDVAGIEAELGFLPDQFKFLPKPCRLETLLTAIANLLRNAEQKDDEGFRAAV